MSNAQSLVQICIWHFDVVEQVAAVIGLDGEASCRQYGLCCIAIVVLAVPYDHSKHADLVQLNIIKLHEVAHMAQNVDLNDFSIHVVPNRDVVRVLTGRGPGLGKYNESSPFSAFFRQSAIS